MTQPGLSSRRGPAT